LQEARFHGNGTQKKLIAQKIEFLVALASQLIGEQEVIQQEVFESRPQVQSQGAEKR
jgi:hypothetical protein